MEDIVDPNCIVKAFERTPITILSQTENNVQSHYFRATDVAQVLAISHIYRTIQNFKVPKERVIRRCETSGGPQDMVFLISRGLYRLLFMSRKPVAEKFRDWVGDILDDIFFNQSQELTKQLIEYKARVDELEDSNTVLGTTIEKDQIETENAFVNTFNEKSVLYLGYVTETIIKFGMTDNFKDRLSIFFTRFFSEHNKSFVGYGFCFIKFTKPVSKEQFTNDGCTSEGDIVGVNEGGPGTCFDDAEQHG